MSLSIPRRARSSGAGSLLEHQELRVPEQEQRVDLERELLDVLVGADAAGAPRVRDLLLEQRLPSTRPRPFRLARAPGRGACRAPRPPRRRSSRPGRPVFELRAGARSTRPQRSADPRATRTGRRPRRTRAAAASIVANCSSSLEPKWANSPLLLMPTCSARRPIERPSRPSTVASCAAASRIAARLLSPSERGRRCGCCGGQA